MNHFAQLIPVLGILITYGLLYLLTNALVFQYRLKKRRSPFTENFLRSPGESLRWQLEDLNDNLNQYLLSALFLPLIFYSTFLTQAHFGPKTPSLSFILIVIMVAALFETYILIKLVRSLKRRRQFRLGYEGELAVGQELNQLLREGYEVYHDFPADKFNIDHIVAGPTGVYAVETSDRVRVGVTKVDVITTSRHKDFPAIQPTTVRSGCLGVHPILLISLPPG